MLIRVVVFLIAIFSGVVFGQTEFTGQKFDNLLWVRAVTNMAPGAAFYLTSDERSVVTATYGNPNQPYIPAGLDLLTRNFNTNGSIDRLWGNLVTLSDGGLVKQPIRIDDEYETARILGDVYSRWVLRSNGRTTPIPTRFIATRRNTLFAVGVTGAINGLGEESLLEFDGYRPNIRIGKIGEFPPMYFEGPPAGFASDGMAVVFADVANGVARKDSFYLADTKSLVLGRLFSWDPRWQRFIWPNNSGRTPVVSTPDGKIIVSILRDPGGNKITAGLAVIDEKTPSSRIIEFPFGPFVVTGMAVGRDRFVYCSLSDRSHSVGPSFKGGVARVNLETGFVEMLGNVTNSVEAPPIITKAGVLLVSSLGTAGAGFGELHAIQTDSVGGLAKSPWPRSTGDNFDSYREQAVDDSDEIGVPDTIPSPHVAILVQPQPQVTRAGDSVTLTVVATNATSFQWIKDGVWIKGATNSTLVINSASDSDRGQYRVIASVGAVENIQEPLLSNLMAKDLFALRYWVQNVSFYEGNNSQDSRYFAPRSLGSDGKIVGEYYENNTRRQAAVTGPNGVGLVKLGKLVGGNNSVATSINDHNQIVGFVQSVVQAQAYLESFIMNEDWLSFGKIKDQNFPMSFFDPSAINDSGSVVGQLVRALPSTNSRESPRPFIFDLQESAIRLLGGLRDDSEGKAVSINSRGQVVGWSRIQPRDEQRAFITGTNGFGMRDLGVLGGSEIQGSNSVATAVNNLGQVVGGSSLHGGDLHAFITEPNGGKMRRLGTLGGIFSHAYDINDNGQVVGWSYTNLVSSPVSHAFVTGENGSGMFDLNLFVHLDGGAQLETADSINNRGQILAHGGGRSYLLTPTTVVSSIAAVEIVCQDINTGLVAYYPFNGRAVDESGFGNHGVLNGATLTRDRFGYPNQAYHFDGASSILVADSKSLNPTNGLTISVWFRADNWDGYGPRLVSKGGYNLCANLATGQKRFEFDVATSAVFMPQIIAPLTQPNVWDHLVAIYATNRMEIYINGSLANASYKTNGSIVRVPVKWGSATEYYDLYIGQKPGDLKSANGYWIGDLDDIRIYNRALSDCEVTALHDFETNQQINRAPTLNALGDVKLLQNSASQTVNLTGIGSGSVDEVQTLTVTATSDNLVLIANPTVTYSSPNATGTLIYKPVAGATGKATITVTVKDDGGVLNGGQDTFSRQFTVTVSPINRAPTLNALADVKLLQNAAGQTVNLSGIGSGSVDEVQGLTVTANSDNPALIANPSVTYTSPNASGSLTYKPIAGATGKATITVTVKDDGGVLNGGQDTFSRQFTLTVTKTENKAPEVEIVSPQDGTTITADVPITLVAEATDSDGTISKVEFYQNSNQQIGTISSSPYQLVVGNLTEGKYTFYAKATDNSGLSGVSKPIIINVLGERRDVAVIKVSPDENIDTLTKYVSEVQLSTHQDSLTWRSFETSEISYEVLSQYRVVIWNNPNPVRGVSTSEVQILKRLIDSGIPIYLIGPNIATSADTLGLSEKRDWAIISSLLPTGNKTQLVNVELQRQDDHGPILDGFYGRVVSFAAADMIDQCHSITNADTLAVTIDGVVLVSYPTISKPEDGETRRFSQMLPVIGKGDAMSIEERQLIFKNALCWLIDCNRCPVVNLAILADESITQPAQSSIGQPFKLKAHITTQNAECPATGIRAVAEFNGQATILDAHTEQGTVSISGGKVYFSFGRIGVHKSVSIEISLIFNGSGDITNKITAFYNGMTSKSVIEFPQVFVVSVLPSLAPTITADRDVTGNVRLRVGGQTGITYVIEKSTAIAENSPLQWSAIKEIELVAPELMHIHVIEASTSSMMFRVRKK